jgi:hypothetical protein
MHQISRKRVRYLTPLAAAVLGLLLCGAAAPTPSPSPPTREALSDAWWTGPMFAASAGTLPRGHLLVEPYVYDVIQYGSYDRSGKLLGGQHANSYGSLSYVIYGLADRLSIGAIPTFGINAVENGPTTSGVRFGDQALIAQYRLAQYRAGSWIPTTSINVQETLPTGKYDRLGDNTSNGFGSGAYTTTVSLYTQTYFWMRNGRILRARVDASDAISGGVNLEGASVYGTGGAFHGTARPGRAFTLDIAQEYSITRNWVFATDFVYRHNGNTQVTGQNSVTNSGPSDAYFVAPAIEYNWTSNSGILLGVRTIPAGLNTSATLVPALAINMVR